LHFPAGNNQMQEPLRVSDADLPIVSRYTDRDGERRYWQIEGVAQVLCGGTHLRRTGEVGAVLLKRNNIGRGKERSEETLFCGCWKAGIVEIFREKCSDGFSQRIWANI